MRTHLHFHLLILHLALLMPCCHTKHSRGTPPENRETSTVASTSWQQPIIQAQSALTFYGWLGPPLGSRLPECAGDCDADTDCQPGLVCFGNSGEEERDSEKIPGCSGFRYVNSDGIKSDYCYDPSKAVANRADLPMDSDALLFVGKDVGFELGKCQGDCRIDRDCRGDLRCFEDKGDTVPGCQGKREKGVDYCYDPNWEDEAKANVDGQIYQEDKPLDITDDPVSIEEDQSSNDAFILDSPEPSPDPTARDTLKPSKIPTNHPTSPPSSRPSLAPITKEPTVSPTLPDEAVKSAETDSPTVNEAEAIPMPTMGKDPTPSPTRSTEAPITYSPTRKLLISAHPVSSPVATTAVELSPFHLILDFYTPRRHLRKLIIQENVDEDEDLLDIVSELLERRLLETYPDTYSDLVMDAEFIDEVEIDSITSAAYRFTGEATFEVVGGFTVPSTDEINMLTQEALNEKDLLMTLRESDDIILELTAGTTLLVNDDNESLPKEEEEAEEAPESPEEENPAEERSEQPPHNSDGMSHSLRITAIVLCSILGVTAVGLLGGYFYVQRKEKRNRELNMYELESSSSRGELQEVTPKRSILHPFASPIKQKGTFDTQESPSPSPQQQKYVQDFDDAELPDLSLPDLDDGYSIGVDSIDFPCTRAERNRTLSNMSNLSQAPLSKRFDEFSFPSSTSLAGESIADDTQASSTVAAASVITGTLTEGLLQSRSQRGQSIGTYVESKAPGKCEDEINSSSDGDLCELGNVHLSSVLDINDGATVASKAAGNNFDMVWRSAKRANGRGSDDEVGSHGGEFGGGSDNSGDTDSIIELTIDENLSDDEEGWNESRLRKFSFDGE